MFASTSIAVSIVLIVLNSKLIPTFCLRISLPVPTLLPVFASPPEAPGAANGFHVLPSQVKTSLAFGVSLLTLLKPLIGVAAILVSTKLLE